MKPGDPLETRDRGFIYEQLDCPRFAADDFEYFIEQCPDDPVADVLKNWPAGWPEKGQKLKQGRGNGPQSQALA